MSLVKFVKGDTTSLNSTYRRQGTGNIEFDSTTKKIYLDGVNYTGEVDSELTQSSNNPVSSSALYKVITENELTTAAALTEHEDAISDINTALNNKLDTLTFDSTPTANSTNPVTSEGIKKVLDDKQDKMVVRFRREEEDTFSCDTSIADIYAAVSAGTEVVGLFYESTSQTWASLRVSVASSTLCIFGMQYGEVYTYLMGFIVNGTDVWQRDQSLNLVTNDQVLRWDNKLDALVSGTNIKTINDQSLLGSGNLDLNPLIFITFWQTDRPTVSSSGQYWYNSLYDTLQVYDGSDWTSVTLSLQKLYIRLTTNEIYRYDGKQMIRMTINPTSLVTT